MKSRHFSLLLAMVAILALVGFGAFALFYSHAAGPITYVTRPPWRFATTAHSKGQFTDAEYTDLSSHYDLIILEKQHDANNINAVYEAARELKRRNSNLKVMLYWETKYWLSGQETSWQEPGYDPGFNPAWRLRDNQGNLIQHGDKSGQFFLDDTNPDYRAWAIAQLQHRFSTAPFDGIDFDNGTDIVQGFNGKDWNTLLGKARIDAYNAGIKDLHTRAQAAFPGKIIVFNGIRRSDNKTGEVNPGRSLYKLDYMDGVMDEGFCLDLNDNLNGDLQADIGLMQQYANKKFFMHTNFYPSKTTTLDSGNIGRYCLGAFLMGWQPGQDYWQYAVGENAYITDALNYSLPEMNINLGNPTGQTQMSGNLYQRGFTNGRVFVNTGASPVNFTLPGKLTQFENGKELQTFNAGASYTLAGQTSAFFLLDSFVHPGSSAPGATSGSTAAAKHAEQATGVQADKTDKSLPSKALDGLTAPFRGHSEATDAGMIGVLVAGLAMLAVVFARLIKTGQLNKIFNRTKQPKIDIPQPVSPAEEHLKSPQNHPPGHVIYPDNHPDKD